jgi:hypothetical protein
LLALTTVTCQLHLGASYLELVGLTGQFHSFGKDSAIDLDDPAACLAYQVGMLVCPPQLVVMMLRIKVYLAHYPGLFQHIEGPVDRG